MARRRTIVKNSNKRNPLRTTNTGRIRKRTQRRSMAVPRFSSVLSDPRVAAWDALLRDPCAGDLAFPCYTGADSGYLVRTVENLSIPVTYAQGGLTPGQRTSIDFFYQFTPFNSSSTTGVVLGGNMAGQSTYNAFAGGINNFITNSGGAVKRYRCVASCLKFVPDGAYSDRKGSIALGYSTGTVVTPGTAYGISSLISEAQRIVPIGSEMHEVRWLPTAVDENFTETASSINNAAGTVFMVLRGVDSTCLNANTISVNGYFEVTNVWEWIPAAGNSLSVAPKAPLPYTSQQVLSTIKDMGAYLFHGLRSGVGQGLVRAGTMAGYSLLSAGVQQMTNRAAPMLIRI